MSAEVIEWIEPSGVTHLLTYTPTGKVFVKVGASGFFMPGFTHIEDPIPFQPGVRRRDTVVLPRTIDLPLYVEQDTDSQLRQLIRDIQNWFNPLKGDGRLRVTAPDGRRVQTYCRLVDTMQIVQSDETQGVLWQDIILSLRGFDPYWYDVIANNSTFVSPAVVAFFPGTPFRLSQSGISATSAPIVNDGDLEAWPIFTIQGPGTGIILTNLDTGEKVQILSDVVLTEGEFLIIDSFKHTVKKLDGTNLYSHITSDSIFWPLYVGTNNVKMEVSSISTNSKVTITFTRRYFSP